MLSEFFKSADFFTSEIKTSADETRERMEFLNRRIVDIEIKRASLNEDIMARINCETKVFLFKLGEYINSPEFQQTFCSWSDSLAPPKEDTWSSTNAKIESAIEDRLQEFLKHWERETQYHETLHRKIMDEFLARFGQCKLVYINVAIAQKALHDKRFKSIRIHRLGITLYMVYCFKMRSPKKA